MTAGVAEVVSGMDDCRLKPQMLRSVVRDGLPDEKRPFPRTAELAAVLSRVRTHGLLSERHSHTAGRKLVEAWRSSVDTWVERIVSLASSSAPDKCWAGSCLLGVTCEECCSDRFQSSYTIWFQKLLENFQSPSATHIIKVACCASLADLFTRLASFPNLKKDGTSFARKVIQPLLQMLNEDVEETCWDVAANLLCTLLSLFPSSIQLHHDNVEAVLASMIMAAKCNLNTSKIISHSLAMLPKVKGNGDSWFFIIQKILIAINSLLTDAFQGLEEERKSLEVMKLIVPPGKDLPPPLGGRTSLEEASEPVMRRLSELLVPRVTTLMHSCCIMLTNSYPFPVLIPARPLLATVGRVLQMDGSFGGSSFPLTSSLHQELLCAELPALHLGSLDLLIAIIKGLRSQLLPHSANVVRLLTEYFQKARMPSIRRKVYSIVQMLLISMGVGMTIYLSQEVISNAFADLADNLEPRSDPVHSNMQSSIFAGETFQQNHDKKRKRTSIIPAEHPNGFDSGSEICSKKSEAPLYLKIAALKTLEALLTMGGSLRSETWRPDVDRLVINVATNACDAGWANEDKSSLVADESSFADFQLAAFEALLASLLSPTETRPPYLSQGLNLFQRGRQETGTKIATFCAHALLALEVLIHPRSLPLMDHLPPKNLSVDAGFISGIKTNLKSDLELLDEEDEQSSAWFDKNDEQIPPESRNLNDKSNETTQKLPNPAEDMTTKAPAINVEPGCNLSGSDEITADRDKTEMSSHNASHNKMDFGQGSLAISIAEMEPGKTATSPVGTTANLRNHGSDVIKLSVEEIKEDSAHTISPDLFKDKDAKLFYSDSDSVSLDSLPSIVDGDPDSE